MVKPTQNDPLIYGRRYNLWREGEYLGIATWVDDENIGDSFHVETAPNQVEVYIADRWELVYLN